ncbi:hypothetical protein AD948_01720 [Acetobacter senegalensis]|uniref:Glycosyltransferase 2-like domain-containing protein n=1 Tax=Acetobacter senegalensis TaxID=446692 RepID=A0A149U7Z6_9PROT|nr:glycosyltransferase [Acetobacter senegalensis]KXV61447.1 hypothetical protein AD948_01720 [Acetobacter senegalensis]
MKKNEIVFKNEQFSSPLQAGSVSIIVPVYNTENYVIETLNSLMGEEQGRHEILVVHDGGTDNSLNLAIEWAKTVENPVAIIDQANAGLSQARMSGLSYARGDYIAFLDSDDVVTPGLYTRMARYAAEEQCELVICRSAVFDDSNSHLSDFYDDWLWNDLLQNAPSKTTSLKDSPMLLRLEPNANTRVMSRAFMVAEGICFEQGLIFEDLPPHTHEIAAARRIGLLNETGYHYRINRPGKITQERSQRRFHIFKSVELAIQYGKQYSIDNEAGAALVSLMTRMIIWCGENVLLPQRQEFFTQACELYATIPEDWFATYHRVFSENPWEIRQSLFLKNNDRLALVKDTLAAHEKEDDASSEAQSSLLASGDARPVIHPKRLVGAAKRRLGNLMNKMSNISGS